MPRLPSDADTLALPDPDDTSRQLARAFLWLGIAALIGSGLLAVVLVLSRTPGIGAVFPLRDFFRAALVVHVDLSVLIWFMAFACVVWSSITGPGGAWLGRLGWGLAALGTLVLTVSPFLPDAQPLLNNYIPVLQQPAFLGGLALCGAGFGLIIVRTLIWGRPPAQITVPAGAKVLHRGALYAALAGALAWITLGWTAARMPPIHGTAYFEQLFWSAGHTLQFQHALLALVAWLWLADALQARPAVSTATLQRLFALAALPLLAVPVLGLIWPVGAPLHLFAFAKLMEWGHLFMLPLLLIVLAAWWRAWRLPAGPARSALLASVLLFCCGGVLAFMIRGVNVVIPAHYHGSIVGVTLAFMGLTFLLLPRLGFGTPDGRLARWQPLVYGGGQLMHILGLAWSGGYGVQRKVAGAEQVLASLPERIGMGMMGLGGLLAVIGGVMFVVVCLKAMLKR